MLEVGNSAESAGEQLNSMSESAIQSFTEMGESIQESVKNQMDIFEEYEKQNEISSDKLIRNMESQVQSVQNWGDNLNELASRADENGLLINEGLLQHLVELGPEGAAYIQAFVEMTDEELKRANELWAESITLPESISERFVKTGESITKGLQKGLSDNTPAVQTAMTNVAASGLDAMNKEFAINSPSKKTQQTGKELIDGLKLGVEENQPVVLSTIQVMSISVVDATRKGLASDIFREIGLQTADGLANGIRAGESNVINAAVEVANAAVAAARSTLGIHSPSKVTEEMGGYYMDGWILGIQARTENLKDAVRGALSTALISETGVADSYGGFSGETEPVAASGNTVYIYFQPQQMTEDEMERAFEYVNTKFGYAL